MLELDGNSLTLARAAAIAAGASATLADAARARVAQSRRFVEQLIARDEIVYGINTGFGKLSEMVIPGGELRTLQLNLVRAHDDAVPRQHTRQRLFGLSPSRD